MPADPLTPEAAARGLARTVLLQAQADPAQVAWLEPYIAAAIFAAEARGREQAARIADEEWKELRKGSSLSSDLHDRMLTRADEAKVIAARIRRLAPAAPKAAPPADALREALREWCLARGVFLDFSNANSNPLSLPDPRDVQRVYDNMEVATRKLYAVAGATLARSAPPAASGEGEENKHG